MGKQRERASSSLSRHQKMLRSASKIEDIHELNGPALAQFQYCEKAATAEHQTVYRGNGCPGQGSATGREVVCQAAQPIRAGVAI